VLRHLRRLAERMPGIEGRDVRGRNHRLLRELALQPFDRRRPLVAVHPEQQAQRPHVAAEVRFSRRETVWLYRLSGEFRDVELENLIAGERVVLEFDITKLTAEAVK